MSQDEVASSSEGTKPVALSIIELCLAEGINQLTQLSRKFSQIKKIKFHNNLLEGFRVNLKIFLGLAMPN